ncbi:MULTISPECIES: bifunctional glutamate N-acetyltransferase/amino-acid acetyltransferase ArgJ [Agrobacterium tumefaciens complex]|jgi:glutamate N-acetyltransferase/amino-acid N-acetyltransferase|uniref:Arginine biosynthesis bifunctional protein ArgJ n=1 Tax=Agrobacterium radiobacter TaxID=362 RepID=A0ABD5LDU6_AGRRD|nr:MULTISPECIES: bifunctional glutamate N-acetyltransferase/amino-acid acetyltransferase ArgJ [Agrobacterium tumefaciens complex]MCP2137114.1 glutamate N-acetyltransferase/amino-acid N-acetyltransferase [Rhizobium sp. SLBN-94]TGE79249.1 bifunctional glutamate N-acetyltransferase/amino-acid acetyltransferase ArgJ [Rhizobium sp. SEMIA 439]EPR22621.1 N-acetylglutamate synthase [Agrobacterium radiobacter DSM 30147]KAB0461446.1 bifunctional glutamate N-acetyltransferase/amino-acid acetyltransferase 
MSVAVSPLAPKSYPDMPALRGVRMATAAAGIKYKNRTDVLLMVFDTPASVAGVFTKSKCPSAPVDFCRTNLGGGVARAVVVNSGNANAFTGVKGKAATELTAKSAAAAVGCSENEVFLASTGVIGEPLDATKFAGVLGDMNGMAEADFWQEAAKAIMTTDTYPKVSTRTAEIGGVIVTINGIAKGAGMIAPDMATMLSFVVTDADIEPAALQALLSAGVGPTFNSVTVDSDTSTSDTLMLFATGAAAEDGQVKVTSADDERLAGFRIALNDLLKDLALQVVRDGEGARKMVEVTVTGAENDAAAKKIALSIANSPLVKTAVAGEDANWGRVVMAVGKSGEMADRDRLAIWFGGVRVAVNGERDPDYSEAETTAVMRLEDIPVKVDIGLGQGKATVWTCDLTKEYVAINGDYRS